MTPYESFWDFAVRTYRCEGVSTACLAVQDEQGADVNVLLFCCWMGVTRGAFDTVTFDAIMKFSNTWAEQVVRPLRSVRTWMKISGCQDPLLPPERCMELREGIKNVEFEAEKLQENVMQTLVDNIPPVTLSAADQSSAAVLNLQRYCTAQNIGWEGETQKHLFVILRAALHSA